MVVGPKLFQGSNKQRSECHSAVTLFIQLCIDIENLPMVATHSPVTIIRKTLCVKLDYLTIKAPPLEGIAFQGRIRVQ